MDQSQNQKPQGFLCSALESIERLLLKNGFVPGSEGDHGEDALRRTFNRKGMFWRRDAIDVIYPRQNGPDSGVRLVLRTTLLGPNGNEVKFDGVDLAALNCRDDLIYRSRSGWLLVGKAVSRSLDFLAKDLDVGLAWFTRYDSVAKTLESLRAGETNLGPILDRGAAFDAQRVLIELGQAEDVRS